MAMTERNKRVAIILAMIFLGGGAVCLACGVFGAFRAQQFVEQTSADAERTIPEADAFAHEHDQVACRDEGLRRSDLCGPMELGCIAQVSVFTERCFRGCAPTPGFCDGVPPMTDIMGSATWANAQCAELGRRGNQQCTSLMQSVQRACHPR